MPTGQHFQFALERNPDFPERQARFSGDVKLMGRSQRIIRYGSAKFEGLEVIRFWV